MSYLQCQTSNPSEYRSTFLLPILLLRPPLLQPITQLIAVQLEEFGITATVVGCSKDGGVNQTPSVLVSRNTLPSQPPAACVNKPQVFSARTCGHIESQERDLPSAPPPGGHCASSVDTSHQHYLRCFRSDTDFCLATSIQGLGFKPFLAASILFCCEVKSQLAILCCCVSGTHFLAHNQAARRDRK